MEGRAICRALWGREPSEALLAAYLTVRTHDHLEAGSVPRLDFLIDRRLDLEAFELALRHRHPLVSRKFRILLYLAESKPETYGMLVNDRRRPVRAWAALAGAVLRFAWKAVKGRLLLWRYGIA